MTVGHHQTHEGKIETNQELMRVKLAVHLQLNCGLITVLCQHLAVECQHQEERCHHLAVECQHQEEKYQHLEVECQL